MSKTELYTSILKKLSSQKEQNIMSLSFLHEIIYYATHMNDADMFIVKIVDVILKYLASSAIYLIDDEKKLLVLKYSTIKDIPQSISPENYEKFINILISKGLPDLNIRQMELSRDVSNCISFYKRFSILPLIVRNVKLPIGIIVVDIDLENMELSTLQILNAAMVLISNSISYTEMLNKNEDMHKNSLRALLRIIRFSDLSTYKHSLRVRKYAIEIGRMCSLSDSDLHRLHISALLHDIGKIAIPCEVLHKEGKLSDEEFEIIKQHTKIGYDILKDFGCFKDSLSDVLNHHEKIDGSGYPNKITDIDKVTQILAIADIIDAISSTRAYKNSNGFSYIIDELNKLDGKYDKKILNIAIEFVNSNRFLVLKNRLRRIEGGNNKGKLAFVSGNLQEKMNQLKFENQNLSKQLELYKTLLSRSQETIEKITQETKKPSEDKGEYDNVVKILFESINPISLVFVKVNDDTLDISMIKGKPLSFETGIQILSNKKMYKAVSSNIVYLSKKMVIFPLFEKEAVCAIISKDSDIDVQTVESVEQSLKDLVRFKHYN